MPPEPARLRTGTDSRTHNFQFVFTVFPKRRRVQTQRTRDLSALDFSKSEKTQKTALHYRQYPQVPVEGRPDRGLPTLADHFLRESRTSDTESSIMKRKNPLASSNRFINRLAATGHPSIYVNGMLALLVSALFTTSSHACDLCGFRECWFCPEEVVSSSDPQSTPETKPMQNSDTLDSITRNVDESRQYESTDDTNAQLGNVQMVKADSDRQACAILLHENGTLEVSGSSDNDWIEVNIAGGFVIASVVYGIDDPNAFWLNRIDKVFALSDVQHVIMHGKDGDDILINGGWLPSQQFGDDGDDVIDGGWGKDIIEGGSGDDDLHGNDGMDYLFGGPGNDILDGSKDFEIDDTGHLSTWKHYPVTDYLWGGAGRDVFINYKKTAPGTGISYPAGTLQDVVLDYNWFMDRLVIR